MNNKRADNRCAQRGWRWTFSAALDALTSPPGIVLILADTKHLTTVPTSSKFKDMGVDKKCDKLDSVTGLDHRRLFYFFRQALCVVSLFYQIATLRPLRKCSHSLYWIHNSSSAWTFIYSYFKSDGWPLFGKTVEFNVDASKAIYLSIDGSDLRRKISLGGCSSQID